MKKETRKIGKEPKKIVLSLSKENIILRAIIAGVCLFLGVVLIVNGCSKMLNKSQYLVLDYPDFEDENGVTSTLFDGNVDLNYYYLMGEEEDSRSIVMNKIDTILNDNMVNIHKLCDYTIVVYVNLDTQIQRLMHRDGITFPDALKKIYAQMPLDEKLTLADYVVDNCHTLADLDWQIKQLLFRLERMI